ncbi:MAG: MOSC domain-containing protein, partial [Gemmatimonadota bacterium]
MNADDVGGVEGVVRRLYIYPVKSAAGVAVDAVEVDVFGPARDRRWLVVDGEAGGRALTQREAPPLALIRPSIGVDGGLALEAPAMERLELPPPSGIADGEATREGGAPGAPTRRVTVWKSVVDAIDAGDEAADWVGRHLGRTCRLVHLPDDAVRRPPRHRRVGPGRLSFVDAAPFLVVTEAALEELNRRLVDPIPMDRFRPSIVVGGAGPHAEDDWPRVEIGGVALRRVKP